MTSPLRFVGDLLRLAAFLAVSATFCSAAATLMQQVDPPEVNVGDQVVVTLTLQGGTVNDLRLPPVEGLQVVGTRSATNITFSNGTLARSLSLNFALVPSHVGDIVIPAFDVRTQEGDLLHVKAMTVHVLANSPPATNTISATATPSVTQNQATSGNRVFDANGPVVMPPTNAAPPPQAPNSASNTDATDASPKTPRDPDGTPAKVFIIITPQTTDAYVGQSIPLEIDFYIRMDVNAEQNSLPTITGSDFLMNNFTTRGHVKVKMLENEEYGCETWLTAISAPKSGDFPLTMTRDTYWIKSVSNNQIDPFGRFFGRHANLAHESIASNQVIMHVHALPVEGQPDHFTGAIGQFQVTGDAQPVSVAVGEPVTLNFSISGTGNFDYVRCPALPEDPAWKSYTPTSKISYRNESHTNAVKTFEQAIIPNKNGIVPLPAATFSYFDPTSKKYISVPIALPAVTVTGSAPPVATVASGENDSAVAAGGSGTAGFIPNRLDRGKLYADLTPVYRKPWFWVTQGGLISLPLLGALFFFLRSRTASVDDRGEKDRRRRSQQQEEDAMADAVRKSDALAFFVAARHAIQLQLGTQWNIKPEALTLREIRAHDAQLAENLEGIFTQADEVIYSGRTAPDLNLAEWDRRARELLQLQPVCL